MGKTKYKLLKRVLLALCLVACFADQTKDARAPERPRMGSLVLVGGGRIPPEVLTRFLQLAGGHEARIVVIPSASSDTEWIEESMAYWRTMPAKHVDFVHTYVSDEANKPELYLKIRQATGVWISGGDQGQLLDIYRGTRVEKEIIDLFLRGGVVGGTSAGASCVSSVMMIGGQADQGFGLLTNMIVDQHFDSRKRLDRLVGLIRIHADQTGVGIDESTALIITGDSMSVLGRGGVSFCQFDNKINVTRRCSGENFRVTSVVNTKNQPWTVIVSR